MNYQVHRFGEEGMVENNTIQQTVLDIKIQFLKRYVPYIPARKTLWDASGSLVAQSRNYNFYFIQYSRGLLERDAII